MGKIKTIGVEKHVQGKIRTKQTKQLRVTEHGKGLGENKTKSQTKRRGNKLTQKTKTKTKTTEQLKRHRKTNGQNEKINKTKDTEWTHEKTKII